MTRPEKSRRQRDSNPGSSAPVADALTTRPERRFPTETERGRERERGRELGAGRERGGGREVDLHF